MQIKEMFRKEIDRELQGVIVVGQGAEFLCLLPGGKIVFGKYLGAAAGVEDGLYHKVAFVHSMPLFSSR